jgi:hypothetical protein
VPNRQEPPPICGTTGKLCGEVRCGRRSAGPGSSCCRVDAAAATTRPHHST